MEDNNFGDGKGPSIYYSTPKGGREGGQTKRYHCVFLLLKSITILTKSVTSGKGGGSKKTHFGVI